MKERYKNFLLIIKNKSAANGWWLFLFLILLFFHCARLPDSDEGIVLNGAWNLINHRQLYIDFFEFISPGSFYLIFWFWKIFGIHYFVAKFLAVIIVFLSSIGIYKITQTVSKNKVNRFFPLIFIITSIYWPIINHNTFNILFIIWAVYFFIKGLSDYSKNNLIISGLLTGLSILFLQQKGIVLLLALSSFLVISLIKEKKYLLLKLNFYFLAFSFLPLLFLLKWPLKTLYENLIVFPIFNYTETAKMPFYLFTIFLIVLLLMIWLFKKEKSKKIWLLLYVQFFLLLSTLPRPDFYHISLILFPLYVLIPISLEKSKPIDLSKKIIYLIILSAILAIIYPSTIFICFRDLFGSIRNNKLISYVKNNCSGPYLYAGPFIPEVYFETEKINATPYSFLITRLHTPEQFLEAKKSLEKYQPTCAVLDYKMVAKFNYDKNNPVDNYILNNYEPTFQEGDTYVYRILPADL
ncbi:MAG: glycosyltransferase family 39 protein [Patescibacteria group bacterium]|nr:glycosyltransferase family 39 protein [Patescibacteria group bacterium]